MKDGEIRDILKNEYHREPWKELLRYIFPGKTLFRPTPSVVEVNSKYAKKALYLGSVKLSESEVIAVYEVELSPSVDIVRNRRGIRDMLTTDWRDERDYVGAFVLASRSGDSILRFSYVSETWDYSGKESKLVSTDTKRFTYLLGKGQGWHTALEQLKKLHDSAQTLADVYAAFSVEALTEQFYQDLFYWYSWAIKTATFPTTNDKDKIEVKIIRLITRLMFVWFIKQKKFVPNKLFETEYVYSVLKEFRPESASSGTYYNAILQNLFFATLNCDIKERRFAPQSGPNTADKTLYHYQDMFSISPDSAVVELFSEIPFLNGGLFECLDKTEAKRESYYDGFSNDAKARAFVPNILFFNQPPQVTQKKKKKELPREGLIPILSRYNFTVEENSHNDMQVALDPELLGKVFENLLAAYNPETAKTVRKQTGSFYTPREIVSYMADQCLLNYIGDTSDVVGKLFSDSDLSDEDRSSLQQTAKKLEQVKILDPACGSGAFPVGLLNRIAELLHRIDPQRNIYDLKLSIIKNCLYGADIQCIATQITKLRFFISLICDTDYKNTDREDNFGIIQLPNLETHFVAADTLIKIGATEDLLGDKINGLKDELRRVRNDHFSARSASEKATLRKQDEELRGELMKALSLGEGVVDLSDGTDRLAKWNPYDQNSVATFFEPGWMFGISEGFDIVIGNPPYISTKGVSDEDKAAYEKEFDFSEDTYNLFTFKGLSLCKKDGLLSFITPKTFWTTQTKIKMRDLLLSKKINYIFDTANPFKSALVDTCVFLVRNTPCENNYKIEFLDGTESIVSPKRFEPVDRSVYINALNRVIFKPSEPNLKVYKKYNEDVKALYNEWWEKISGSDKIERYSSELKRYRASLKPGELTLLGCLTDGGVGLQTGSNGNYIALRSSTKMAEDTRKTRPKRLAAAIENYGIRVPGMKNFSSEKEFLSSLSESEIAALFDDLKEQYGRDIFGRGYLYRIIEEDQLADLDSLTAEEKENGIAPNKRHYVPYDKGDRGGNRWYLETPYAISWTKKNVAMLKIDPRARYQGEAFYFREGLCWSCTSDVRIRCRMKRRGIYDVNSMSVFSVTDLPDEFFVCVLNSKPIGEYLRAFINNTVAFQINDARQLPIIIPNKEQTLEAKNLVKEAIYIKTHNGTDEELEAVQERVNNFVTKLYNFPE